MVVSHGNSAHSKHNFTKRARAYLAHLIFPCLTTNRAVGADTLLHAWAFLTSYTANTNSHTFPSLLYSERLSPPLYLETTKGVALSLDLLVTAVLGFMQFCAETLRGVGQYWRFSRLKACWRRWRFRVEKKIAAYQDSTRRHQLFKQLYLELNLLC